MDPLIASIALSAAFVALCFSTVALMIHWFKRKEPAEVTEVWSAIQALKTDHLDLMDKVEHWRRRDSVRRARQGAEDKAAPAVEPETPADRKAELRRKAVAAGLTMAGGRD